MIVRDQYYESRCQACKYYFGPEGPASPAGYDCACKCGLCAVCPYNPTVKNCDIFYKDEIFKSVPKLATREKQAICLNCKGEYHL